MDLPGRGWPVSKKREEERKADRKTNENETCKREERRMR